MLNVNCHFCKENNNLSFGQEEKCIENALDSLKAHFTKYKKLLFAKQDEIQVLQEHNARLMQAVELLKCKSQNPTENVPQVQELEDLNRALTSAEILDNCPELRSSSPNECVIAETEIFKSPIKIPKRVLKKANMQENTVTKNISRDALIQEWRTKENENKRKHDASKRLRQSRLQFEKIREDSEVKKATNTKTDSTFNRPAKVSKTSSSFVQSLLANNQQLNWEEDEDDFEDTFAMPTKSNMKCLSLTKKSAERSDFMDSSLEEKSVTPSIIVLSPPPPEIVCLDESIDADTTQINTMELLHADDSTLERAEQKLMEIAKRANKETSVDNKKVKSEDKTNTNITEMENEDDVFDHRPILIKKEPESPANNKQQNDPNDFIGIMQETPDGFWNPLLLSFEEDDPRKEVLRDTRLNKK